MAQIFFAFVIISAFWCFGCQSVSSTSKPQLTEIEQAKDSPSTNENKIPESNKVVDADFEKNRRLWSEQKITNYNMVVSIITLSFVPTPEPVLIEVRDGKAVSSKLLSEPHPGSMEIYTRFDTIDKVFSEIQKGLSTGDGAGVNKYNKKFGYPEKFTIYSVKVDGGLIVTIKKLEVIE